MRLILRTSVCIVLILLSTGAALADGIEFTWISKDTSKAAGKVEADGVFVWINPDGTIIRQTGVPGSSVPLSDTKDKKGNITFTLPTLPFTEQNLSELNTEQLIPFIASGQVLTGFGEFHLSFTGFNGINDMTATFTANLVSDGTDNPLSMTFPTPGILQYVTKWRSTDVITLSNGANLVIGDFYLLSSAVPSSFSFSVAPDISSFTATFTTQEDYFFVFDLGNPPSGSNLRHVVEGEVTKDMSGTAVPEPTAMLLLGTGLAGVAIKMRKRLKSRKSGQGR